MDRLFCDMCIYIYMYICISIYIYIYMLYMLWFMFIQMWTSNESQSFIHREREGEVRDVNVYIYIHTYMILMHTGKQRERERGREVHGETNKDKQNCVILHSPCMSPTASWFHIPNMPKLHNDRCKNWGLPMPRPNKQWKPRQWTWGGRV